MTRIARLLLAAFFSLAVFPAAAQDQSGDRAAFQAIISDQIAAFQADNGAAAYAFASPMIQSLYPNAAAFMAMVKGAYQPVYHPRSVTFGETLMGQSGPMQKVYLVGPDGESYVAVYSLQQQPDGSWKINGCQLLKDTSPTT